MKKLIILSACFLFVVLNLQAQNEDVVKETVTEKIVVKDNESVKVIVTDDVKEVVSEVKLEGTGAKEQSSTTEVKEDRSALSTAVEVQENEENIEAITELRAKEAKELEESIQRTKAENEKNAGSTNLKDRNE
ncbi:MAG TPA: hypothetical protein VKZ42_03755 [Flavobacteriaceae bacterium]|nr:hypothetical protein [Flavobacteriaceae bacterium]